MNVSSIKIRMYRQGFGDCFLLTFSDENNTPFYLMIDFGVYVGQVMMDDIAEDIVKVTGGKVDTLVITHEHWDHVSGFTQTDILDKLAIDRLWLAWTEDPTDPRAAQLQTDKLSFVNTIGKAFTALAAAPQAAAQCETLANLLAFEGITLSADPTAMAAAAGVNKTKTALDAVKTKATPAKTTYLIPGQVVSLKTAADEKLMSTGEKPEEIRVYVLGPPRDRDSLKLMDRKGDLYPDEEDKKPPRFSMFSWAAASEETGEADEFVDENSPAADTPFGDSPFVHREGSEDFVKLEQEKFGKDKKINNNWRDISIDWLGASSTMALQLNTYTNNTSLVLAIELTRQGKVLLFPGDAQLGNWKSWQSVQFGELDRPATPVATPVPGKPAVTTDDLLARTVFYKVGHHGSHNATPRGVGLEKMTNPNLVAMMPVSHAMIDSRKWPIPFESLRKRLVEKTRDQCLRADTLTESGNIPPNFTVKPLFIEYELKP